ncbi:MAG: hypothetical protein M5U07_10185 [Xanthobacteraceae bacterium]|nr:hypothetical protein [Xanthobacteraceae bacterium]
MLTKITKLEKLGGFRLAIHFNDGSHGVHDFAALVNEPSEMREPLRDPTIFSACFSNSAH